MSDSAAVQELAPSKGLPSPIAPWSLCSERERWGSIAILFLVSTSSFVDRYVVSVVLEPIKYEFKVSDTMLGLLTGPSFALFYALAGVPVARWADRGDRRLIIAVAVAVWSATTMLCGLATTFWQLALARVGVGIGESGTIPPGQSLIADYFSPERRATPVAIVLSASTVGFLLGISLGGYLAATHGWRTVFLCAGAPGLAVALIVRFALAEPRFESGFPKTTDHLESMSTAVAHLRSKRSYVYVLASCLVYFAYTYSMGFFIPSYLVRVLHAPLARASVTYGIVEAAASLIGTLAGGWLTGRLMRRDLRWLAWFPAITFMVTGPLYVWALAVASFWHFMALDFIAALCVAAAFPAVFTTIHTICGNRRRATAVALVLFSATLCGAGLGPLLAGALSDALSATYGVVGLRYSLMLMMTTLVMAGALLYRGANSIPRDVEP